MNKENDLENRIIELEAKLEIVTNALLSIAKPKHKNFALLALTIRLKASEVEQIQNIFMKAVTENMGKQQLEDLLIEAIPERQNVFKAIAEAFKSDEFCVSACNLLLKGRN